MLPRTFLRHVVRRPTRAMSTSPPSAHAQYYSDIVPAMIPIALLGSAVYLSLQLLQSNLSHEKHLEAANARVAELEAQVQSLVNK